MRMQSRGTCWRANLRSKHAKPCRRVLKARSTPRGSWQDWQSARPIFRGGNDMLTRRVFIRGSAIVMAGVGAAPHWLARAAGAADAKRKILVAIFQRGAADGLNIVVPFGEKRYYEMRPSLAI